MDSAMVFSFLYFIAFGIALLFGILHAYINPRGGESLIDKLL